MDKYWKDKWITALRSGEYKQGQEFLKNTYSDGKTSETCYCCLGVLCDLVSKEPNVGFELMLTDGDGVHTSIITGAFESEDGYWEDENLPNLVAEVVGLADIEYGEFENDPFIKSKGKEISVLNDDGMTFEEIADLIEKEL